MNVLADRFVRATTAVDLAAVCSLLEDSALPTADLKTAPNLRFWVLVDGEVVVGSIGLERYGASGLLQSLAVSSNRQRHGLGQELVRRLERAAAADGVKVFVLLTQTAGSFFRRLGYIAVDRESAPAEIKASAEFRSLCPASAVCMSKVLS